MSICFDVYLDKHNNISSGIDILIPKLMSYGKFINNRYAKLSAIRDPSGYSFKLMTTRGKYKESINLFAIDYNPTTRLYTLYLKDGTAAGGWKRRCETMYTDVIFDAITPHFREFLRTANNIYNQNIYSEEL